MATSAASTRAQRGGLAWSPLRNALASDRQLAVRARDGDEAAFATLYERHHRGLLSFCRHMLGSLPDAEDAVQQTFASAYRALLTDARELEPRPWLFAIARNACVDALRRRSSRPQPLATEPSTDGLAAVVERRDELRLLLRALQGLPEQQRSALLLAELGGLGHDEIAGVLGCRPDQVKSHVFQARTKLIAERAAADTSCAEIRAQLASLRGGSLLRGELRRHMRDCAGCRQYRSQLHRQHKELALLLPVVPSAGLKHATLAAALGWGGSSGGSVAAAGGAGGLSALAAKALVAVALAGATGGTVAALTHTHSARARAVLGITHRTRPGGHASSGFAVGRQLSKPGSRSPVSASTDALRPALAHSPSGLAPAPGTPAAAGLGGLPSAAVGASHGAHGKGSSQALHRSSRTRGYSSHGAGATHRHRGTSEHGSVNGRGGAKAVGSGQPRPGQAHGAHSARGQSSTGQANGTVTAAGQTDTTQTAASPLSITGLRSSGHLGAVKAIGSLTNSKST